jgi:hypothetical protein
MSCAISLSRIRLQFRDSCQHWPAFPPTPPGRWRRSPHARLRRPGCCLDRWSRCSSWFMRRQLPCLVVGSCATGVSLPSVDADYRATCRHAGGMLSGKGHRSIALIRPEGDYGGDRSERAGTARGPDPERKPCAVFAGAPAHDGTPAHLCALLDKALRSPHPPTALVVARAVHVLTVMMFLMQRGKRIPQDMAVVSRDDEAFLQHTVPAGHPLCGQLLRNSHAACAWRLENSPKTAHCRPRRSG